jgi:hypothetical protein
MLFFGGAVGRQHLFCKRRVKSLIAESSAKHRDAGRAAEGEIVDKCFGEASIVDQSAFAQPCQHVFGGRTGDVMEAEPGTKFVFAPEAEAEEAKAEKAGGMFVARLDDCCDPGGGECVSLSEAEARTRFDVDREREFTVE